MSIQYHHIVALIYTVALFLDRLDLTIVNITLPTLATVFDVPITATDFVNLSFLFALAISIPISCWLGDKFGYKKILILSMLLFGTGSTLCAWAPNFTSLVMLRFIHGIGGGLLIPVGMTIVYRVYDKSDYASITSFTFMPALIAPAIAPFLGGILLDTLGWQSVFLLSGPITLVLALVTFLFLKEDRGTNPHPLDIKGFILFALILLDIFYILSFFGKAGGFLLFCSNLPFIALLIYLFIKCEKKSAHPLIDLNYFKNDIFTKINFIQLCFQFCHFGAIFLIAIYLQMGIGMSATIAGLVMGMQAIGAITTSRYSVKLFNLNPKLPLIAGLSGVAILSPCILFIEHTMIPLALLLFFVRGLFSGLCGTPIQTLSVISFNKEQIGAINTIFNACRQVSISVGVAISSALIMIGMQWSHLSLNQYTPLSIENTLKIFGPGFIAISIVAIIGIMIVIQLKISFKSNP